MTTLNSAFLLKSGTAERLYYEYAQNLPIIDYHNHLSVADIAGDRQFDSLYDLWIASDPYKHRLMRILGIEEHFITGGATPYEKVERFFSVFPFLAGNPVYDWGRMELSAIFGIEELPSKDNARYIFDKTKEMLKGREFSTKGILSKFNVEYISPIASLTDDLQLFDGTRVAPSLRGDNLLSPDADLKAQLSAKTGINISDNDSYLAAVSTLLDDFAAKGCRFADHALDDGFFDEGNKVKQSMLIRLAEEYKKRNLTLLLHLDAKRKTSERLARLAGPAGGYAGVGGRLNISALTDMLGKMEASNSLPDTVLFPLNMNDQASLAVLQGSFSEDRVESKVQLGPAWWWCDHSLGIENTLNAIASFGVVSSFIGMTTDSRSILSFVRHDYFRRILCSWFAKLCEERDLNLPFELQGEILERIAYFNAKKRIKR